MHHRRASAVMMAASVALASGCGSSRDYAKEPRPATQVTVTAAIDRNRVLVSPTRVGFGVINLVVANETQASQQLTLSSDQPGVLQAQTGPINPGDTASLQANLKSGSYQLHVEDSSIASATITVSSGASPGPSQILQP